MKFAEFICLESIQVDLKATEIEDVIREMVASLRDAGKIAPEQYEDIVKAIMKREELGSTGIGRCVAVPHTKHASIKQMVGTVAVSPGGVKFDSLDGQPVHVLFLLVSPPDDPQEHLRALEHISRQLRDDMFRRFIMQVKSAEDVIQLLDEADEGKYAV